MRHLKLAEIAKMLSAGSPFADRACRHLAEACPTCGRRLRQVEALMRRFRHWDPEVAVHEGLEADGLFAAFLAEGHDAATWPALVEQREELQTWGVAWVALERAQGLIADGAANPQNAEARDLALLAAAIAEHLGTSYHPESVADLKALAYAIAAAASEPPARTPWTRGSSRWPRP
jgi:hypothetical protein